MDNTEQAIQDKTTEWSAAREDRVAKFAKASESKATHDADHAAANDAMALELKLRGELLALVEALPAEGDNAD